MSGQDHSGLHGYHSPVDPDLGIWKSNFPDIPEMTLSTLVLKPKSRDMAAQITCHSGQLQPGRNYYIIPLLEQTTTTTHTHKAGWKTETKWIIN